METKDKKLILYLCLILYLIIFIIAELATTYHNIQAGLIIHSVLMITLLGISSLLYNEKDLYYFIMSLILTPLIRLLSTATPIYALKPIYWFLLINFPLLIAVILLARYQGIGIRDLGLTLIPKQGIPIQTLIILTGPLLGLIEYHILKPEPMMEAITPGSMILSFLIFMIFTGFIEELIFRGIIQRNAEKILGNHTGLLFAALLFSIMHIGWKSLPDLGFVFAVGLFYGIMFQRTRNLIGISISHGLTNIFLFVIIPLLLG